MTSLLELLGSVAWIAIGMVALAVLETIVPLRALGRLRRAHLAPNLVLAALTIAANALCGAALAVALARIERSGGGIAHAFTLPPLAATVLAVLALDLATYAAHVALHRVPAFWRLHRVHHSDPAVDVTTSLRQHPGETLVRQAFLAASALALGASPAACAIYRTASALFALLEHANLRVPSRVDDALSLVVTWPTLHKVHHARDPRLTDTNYGNLVSWWDRCFGTFTSARRGAGVTYGLADLDDPATQTTAGLLALPFRAR
jgi:sterol desaturase/sphingolipid hydroxylase (fatty acid hydroxylase superfamily)